MSFAFCVSKEQQIRARDARFVDKPFHRVSLIARRSWTISSLLRRRLRRLVWLPKDTRGFMKAETVGGNTMRGQITK